MVHPSRNAVRHFAEIFIAAPLALTGCNSSKTVPSAGAGTPPKVTTVVASGSSALCQLEGGPTRKPGVWGTDLGISFVPPKAAGATDARIAMLFGDTWPSDTSICDYPPRVSDDLQASLPLARPANLDAAPTSFEAGASDAGASGACAMLVNPPPDPSDPSTPRPLRLFANPSDRSDANLLDTGYSRTPTAGFSDGTHAFMMFVRGEAELCTLSSDCAPGMVCTSDPGYTGKRVGACQPPYQLSADPSAAYCQIDRGGAGDCGAHRTCQPLTGGVCLEAKAFELATASGTLSPDWYDQEPLRALSQKINIATARWSDRPEDYGTGAVFVTNKFLDASVRTVAHFDPNDESHNDYRPGTDTLFMWGRPSFQARGGFQSLPFLLYQPLKGLVDDDGTIHFAPHFFAGYAADGKPKWSTNEADAIPIYGTDVTVGQDAGKPELQFTHPEFDLVNQMSVTYVEALGRWVMLYGGDFPTWLLYDPATNTEVGATYPEPVPGAIYLRHAAAPWGRSTLNAPVTDAWTEPQVALTRDQAAPFLGCDNPPSPPGCTAVHDPHRPLQMLLEIDAKTNITPADYATVTSDCLNGDAVRNATYALSGDAAGHLYGANIIEPWTADVTATKASRPGERVVDLYWNASAWNPYGVVLVKTELRGR